MQKFKKRTALTLKKVDSLHILPHTRLRTYAQRAAQLVAQWMWY